MFEKIRTGRVSKKLGVILVIGTSACIILVVLSGIYFNSRSGVSQKIEKKNFSVESNLKYADKVASNLAKQSVSEEDKSAIEKTDIYDAKAVFEDSAESSDKNTAIRAALETEDYLREYIRYREKGHLLDRNSKKENESYVSELTLDDGKDSSKKAGRTDHYKSSDYQKAKNAPTRIELRFNHDEVINTADQVKTSQEKHRTDNIFSNSYEKEPGFDRENQTLDKYAVFERDNFSLDNEVIKPKTPFALMQGTVISAVLSTGINSELPGQISAMVTRDIRDSIRGKYLLIPRGSKLLGQYGSTAAFGSQRLFLGFNRIIFPNGHSINIGSMPGQSSDGFAGFDADVDNHYFRIISNCLLLSSITTAANSVQHNYRNAAGIESLYTSQARELSSDVSDALGRIIEKNINLAPTLKVQPGYKFTISLTKDIFFKSPYGTNTDAYFIKY